MLFVLGEAAEVTRDTDRESDLQEESLAVSSAGDELDAVGEDQLFLELQLDEDEAATGISWGGSDTMLQIETKNGIYLNLVEDVRDAFEGSHLVKINCQGMHTSDYKRIGAKLKELVPCVLLSFDQEQILMWRGNDWKSKYQSTIPLVSKLLLADSGISSASNSSGQLKCASDKLITKKELSTPKMLSLWKRAIDSCKALLLAETEQSPDTLLERVEEFEGLSQTVEHSYPALLVSSEEGQPNDGSKLETDDDEEDDNDVSNDRYASDEDYADSDDDISDSYDEVEPSVSFGSLPVDLIAERLNRE